MMPIRRILAALYRFGRSDDSAKIEKAFTHPVPPISLGAREELTQVRTRVQNLLIDAELALIRELVSSRQERFR